MKAFRLSLLLPLGVLIVSGFSQRATPPAAQGGVTTKVVAAANAFLATLSEAERGKVSFDFNSTQKTTGWSNLPSGIFQRNGLRIGDLTAPQREAALALVAAALSRYGYQKVTDIMNGDEVLKNRGGGRTGGRQGGGRRRARWRRSVRHRRVLHGFLGTPSVTTSVDDPVRRASSRHQRHDRRPEQRHDAEPAGRAARARTS